MVKNRPAYAGNPCSVPGSGRCPGEGNGNSVHYFYLGNPMDREAWQATVHGVVRVGHDLATKPPPGFQSIIVSDSNIQLKNIYIFLFLKSTTQSLGFIQDPS